MLYDTFTFSLSDDLPFESSRPNANRLSSISITASKSFPVGTNRALKPTRFFIKATKRCTQCAGHFISNCFESWRYNTVLLNGRIKSKVQWFVHKEDEVWSDSYSKQELNCAATQITKLLENYSKAVDQLCYLRHREAEVAEFYSQTISKKQNFIRLEKTRIFSNLSDEGGSTHLCLNSQPLFVLKTLNSIKTAEQQLNVKALPGQEAPLSE